MTGFLCALPLVARPARLRRRRTCWRSATSRASTSTWRRSARPSWSRSRCGRATGSRPGQVVARQERTDAEIALAEAEAAREQAEAELANLREGSRPEEIAVTEAALEAARVRLREAERQAERQTALAGRDVVSAGEPRHRDRRPRHRARPRWPSSRRSSRSSACRRARRWSPPPRAGCAGAEAAVRDARWRLDKRTIAAPVAGAVADVFRRVGEIAGPTEPVVSILPDGAYKVVVFVGETDGRRDRAGRPSSRCAATAARTG